MAKIDGHERTGPPLAAMRSHEAESIRGQGFKLALARIVASQRLPDDLCSITNQDNRTKLIRPEWLRKLIYGLNSILIAWLCDLHRIDLLNPYSTRGRSPFKSTIGKLLHNKAPRTHKLWPWFALAAYIVICALLAINIYYQYILDANVAKLDRLSMSKIENAGGDDKKLNLTELKLEAQQKIDDSRKILLRLGASHLNWSFVIQSGVILLIQSFHWFVIYPSRHYVNEWILLPIRAILNQANEIETRVQLIMDEVERFRLESFATVTARLSRLNQNLQIAFDKIEMAPVRRDKMQSMANEVLTKMSCLVRGRHAILMSRLQSVALSGRLNPLNGTPTGRDQIALSCFLPCLLFLIYATMLVTVVHSSVSRYFEARGKRIEHRGLADILNTTQLFALLSYSALSACFWTELLYCNFSDEFNLNKHLRTFILSVVRMNETRFVKFKWAQEQSARMGAHKTDPPESRRRSWRSHLMAASRQEVGPNFTGGLCARLAHEFESDLITIILQYRLVCRSSMLARDLVQGGVSVLVMWAIAVPIVLMIHGAYLSADVRLLLLTLSAGGSFVSLVLLAPFGLLYTRRLALFKTLWTLVGQLTLFETVPEVNSHLDLGESVSLATLRRLLGESQSLSRNLSFRFLSMPITYSNLGRLFSYIIVAIMAGSMLTTRLFGDGFASLMADPFGLFDFSGIK